MSMRIKLNVKNVILGCHNFSDLLATHDTRIPSGFSRSLVPRATFLCRPDCDNFKQASVGRSTSNNAESLLPLKSENLSLKWVSLEKPVTSKWLDQVLTGPICIPACRLPWESAYSFYYDKKCPQCPPPALTARTDCPKCPVPPCPPPKLVPTCPQKPKCYPCKKAEKSDSCAKITSCTMKTILLNNYRFYSASPWQPKTPRKKRAAGPCKKPSPCPPKQARYKPSPKCRPRRPTGCAVTASKPKICKPKFGGGGGSKQNPCGGKTEPKSGGSHPVCPPKKKSVCGGGSEEIKKGPVCK